MSQGTAPTAERHLPCTVLHWIIQITGELLITIGLLLLLFVAWQLWWTNIDADRTQSQAVSTLVQGIRLHPRRTPPRLGPQHPARRSERTRLRWKSSASSTSPNSDPGYRRPATQGTSSDVDSSDSATTKEAPCPGQVGNFSAGHRQTCGKVLSTILHRPAHRRRPYLFTCAPKTATHLPSGATRNRAADQVEVIEPFFTARRSTHQRLLTLTTCHHGTRRRGGYRTMHCHARLESWRPAAAGARRRCRLVAGSQIRRKTDVRIFSPPLACGFASSLRAIVLILAVAYLLCEFFFPTSQSTAPST